MTDSVEMLYFDGQAYSATHEGGLRWIDPAVAIDWPLELTEQSARDADFPGLDTLEPIRT